MGMHDDDEDELSWSSAERFTRADPKAQLRELKEKSGKGANSKNKLMKLQLQRQLLQQQMQPQDGQPVDAAGNPVPETFGTKTEEQEARQEVQTAQDRATTDKMLKEQAREEAAQDAASEEYQQDAG